MKKISTLVIISTFALVGMGCVAPENSEEIESTQEDMAIVEETVETDEKVEKEEEDEDEENTEAEEQAEDTTATSDDNETPDLLNEYSNEEIEYARIWIQFGPNPDVEELSIEKIPAGAPINPLDKGSLDYPEDVIQLTGVRLVDGIVTYSSNGDGSINLFNVPARWENPETYDNDSKIMEEETRKIIKNTETVYVEPGDAEAVADVAGRIQN